MEQGWGTRRFAPADMMEGREVLHRAEMRAIPLFLLVVAVSLPVTAREQRGASAIQPVTVAELEQMLARAHGEKDRQLAKELATIELTERLSDVRRERWDAEMPGSRSRAALQVIADVSAFLPLPTADIPDRPAPDVAMQRRIVAQMADYVNKLPRMLPNLFATRVTFSFRNMQQEVLTGSGQGMVTLWQPMKLVSRNAIPVTYRDGTEVEGAAAGEPRPNESHPLVTRGEFGPILSLVLLDAHNDAQMRWSHWEQSSPDSSDSHGLEAVFTYSVPLAQSEFEPGYCCIRGKMWEQRAAYHGEIAVDPSSGVIRRLTLVTDLPPGIPLVWTGTMVRYGPVNLGGKSYPCPLQSVSITQAKPEPGVDLYADTNPMTMALQPSYNLYAGPMQTLLNDTVFEGYHLFHATVRILPSQ